MGRLLSSGGKMAVIRAYAVHFYTSLGLVAALLALIATVNGRPRDVFVFLGLALWIDSTDGTLARGWDVRIWTPRFDGRKLDDITDYLTYTFVPVFFAYQYGVVSREWLWVLAIVLLSSVYGFCQKAAKTDDGYFTGWPSYWNMAIFYMYIVHGNPVVNAFILLLLSVMVFVPIKYIYPSRTPVFHKLNIGLGAFWFVTYCLILVNFYHLDLWLVYMSLIYPAYYMGMSFFLHFRPQLASWVQATRARES